MTRDSVRRTSDLVQARLWTSLRNPKGCKREQATKNPDPI